VSNVVNERSAGVWAALVVYAIGGAYMLGFWALLDRTVYLLAFFGVVSIVIAAALFKMSRWAWWLGLFTFPLFFIDVAYALLASVSFVGGYPDTMTALFHGSMLIYLVFLCFAFILLIDRRNVLRSDRVLDLLSRPLSTKKTKEPQKSKE
jgi:hypothetical protein